MQTQISYQPLLKLLEKFERIEPCKSVVRLLKITKLSAERIFVFGLPIQLSPTP